MHHTEAHKGATDVRDLLETHLCDVDDTELHESSLKVLTRKFFESFDLESEARIFNALAKEHRLKILNLLTIREMCVCELAAALDLSQPNITYHMKKLENVGLVEHNKRGKWVYYSLAEAKTGVHACQLKCLAECFDDYDALDRDDARLDELKQQGTCASAARAC